MSVGEYYAQARENWRLLLLVVFLVTSGVAIAPGANAEGPTDLKYGLDLNGGTRVQAPFVGMTAESVDYGEASASVVEVERTVADELGVPSTAVQARPNQRAFEVYSDNFTREEIASALQEAGLSVQPGDVRDGVTSPTRQDAKGVIERKIQESPELSGGRVQIVNTPGGDYFIRIEVPNAERDEVLRIVRERGLVEVVAVYPDRTGNNTTYQRTRLFTQSELAGIQPAREDEQGPHVSVTLSEPAAENFSASMRQYGFTDQGVGQCRWGPNQEEMPDDPGYCLVTYKDGEKVYAASIAPSLAELIRNDEFPGTFRMETTSFEEATELQIALRAGSLPTDIDVEDRGTTSYIEPSLAQQFKLYSLITGIVAAIAVGAVVFVRYGKTRVAVPMLLTALAEVFILLGFAASIGLPLDLAHIAGFIAVIGTGVDDLVIIADEVLSQGDVRTRRVFQSRFRKAFWVIGAAAATTIIAMSPLTVLSLGDLSGFAIVTIVGVLIGVLITRPAYGDILRVLMTRQQS